MKKTTCPFCGGEVTADKPRGLRTFGDSDYIHFKCVHCDGDYWITEYDFDSLD